MRCADIWSFRISHLPRSSPFDKTTLSSYSCGPVAQLVEREHGMFEVAGSIPVRSTKFPNAFTFVVCPPALSKAELAATFSCASDVASPVESAGVEQIRTPRLPSKGLPLQNEECSDCSNHRAAYF